MASSPALKNRWNNQEFFEYADIKDRKKLGRGSFGTVYSFKSDERYAFKVIPRRLSWEARTEYEIMKAGLPHIVRSYGSFESNEAFVYSMERMQGSLSDFLKGKESLPIELYLPIFFDIVKGMRHLIEFEHKVHRDLEPDNILLDFEKRAYIADFGLFGEDEEGSVELKSYKGTPYFMAPEMKSQLEKHNPEKLDVYSLGVITLLILDSDVYGENDKNSLEKNMESFYDNAKARPRRMKESNHIMNFNRIRLKLEESVPKIFFELLERMLMNDFRQRPTFAEIYSFKGEIIALTKNYVHRKHKITNPSEVTIEKEKLKSIRTLKISPK